jgi:16S rRNA G966 N2-methylase RsmD
LFAGSGAISYEFASRGGRNITTVDRDEGCVQFIRQTAHKFGIEPFMHVIQADALDFIDNCLERYDVVFAGPPYAMEDIEALPDLVFENELLKAQGFFILEHAPNLNFELHPQLGDVRNYGKTYFSIFRPDE